MGTIRPTARGEGGGRYSPPPPYRSGRSPGGEGLGREAGEPSLNTYRHAGNLFTGVMEHANCAALISLSVSGKLTCDDSSMGIAAVELGKEALPTLSR